MKFTDLWFSVLWALLIPTSSSLALATAKSSGLFGIPAGGSTASKTHLQAASVDASSADISTPVSSAPAVSSSEVCCVALNRSSNDQRIYCKNLDDDKISFFLTFAVIIPIFQNKRKQDAKRPMHILFLSADTGGGHRASAESLAKQVRIYWIDTYTVVMILGFSHFSIDPKLLTRCNRERMSSNQSYTWPILKSQRFDKNNWHFSSFERSIFCFFHIKWQPCYSSWFNFLVRHTNWPMFGPTMDAFPTIHSSQHTNDGRPTRSNGKYSTTCQIPNSTRYCPTDTPESPVAGK